MKTRKHFYILIYFFIGIFKLYKSEETGMMVQACHCLKKQTSKQNSVKNMNLLER